MSQQQKHSNSMYKQTTTTQEIISPNDGKHTLRIARFLKPLAINTSLVTSIPKTPFLYELFSHKNLKKWPFEVNFTGWNKPLKDWRKWYCRLVVDHGSKWLLSGIADGIHSSMYNVPCCKEVVLAVCEFWRPTTNTFVFPWGEATITLEDVVVLGGFSLLGGCIDKKVEGDLVGVVNGLKELRREMSKDGVTHCAWIEHFMEDAEEGEICDEEGEFDHVAFLSLWLSRFVFPSLDEGVITYRVFPIAAHLSKGTRLSIAPIVLANLYHDLTWLVEKAKDPCFHSKRVDVCGLFHIVQLWVFERFPDFAENLAKPLCSGDPRVARWDNVEVKLELSDVRSKFILGEGFRWRPYADGLENWDILPFYEEKEQIIDKLDDVLCSDLLSYSRFCHPSMLVGVNGDEKYKYNPHRVALQLGYDQDLPAEMSVSNPNVDHFGFLVPSKNFEPGMTKAYYDWWKDSISHHKKAVRNVLKPKWSEKCDQMIIPTVLDAPVQVNIQSRVEKQLPKERSTLKESEICQHVSSDLDNVPLALRICTKMATKKDRGDKLTGHRSQSLNAKTGTSDSHDIDHVPLSVRLETILEGKGNDKGTAKLTERLASTANAKNCHSSKELASPTSYRASQIIRKKRSSLQTNADKDKEIKVNVGSSQIKARKESLEVRIDKLNKFFAKLEAGEFGPEFSVSS